VSPEAAFAEKGEEAEGRDVVMVLLAFRSVAASDLGIKTNDTRNIANNGKITTLRSE